MTYRGYRITPLGTYSLLKIQGPGSGPVPTELLGEFTSSVFAKQAIDRSLDSLKTRKRGKQNDTEASAPSAK